VEPPPLDGPLLSMDNVVFTPHVAGATYETSRRRGTAAAQNVQRVARGDKHSLRRGTHAKLTPLAVAPNAVGGAWAVSRVRAQIGPSGGGEFPTGPVG
jgi:hypothetical protein